MKITCITSAASRLAIYYPFWTEVFYSMSVVEDTTIPTLATDGLSLYVNPQFFGGLPVALQVSALVHELYHKILLHPSRRGHRDAQLWNMACDYAVNAGLKKQGMPLGDGWLYEARFENMTADAIYAILAAEVRGNSSLHRMPAHLRDIREADMTPEEVQVHENDVKALVERAMANARAMGNMPAGIEDGSLVTFKATREPWYNHLHRFMQSIAASGYNWAQLNRRTVRTHGYFAPSHQDVSLGKIALFIDTSGSCFDAAAQSGFAAHVNAILGETRPEQLHVYYFDAAVYPGEVIEPGMFDFVSKPKGGGGTYFRPIFARLDEDGVEPAVCIILTDLCGSFPAEGPDYPVVWANIEANGEAPFGETIYVE